MRVCQGCGGPLPPNRAPGSARKWCSERCRKSQYDLVCVDCGGRASGTDPGSRGDRPPRCGRCARIKSGHDRKVWTRDAILAAIRAWADEHGEPPAVPDWRPYGARRLGDEPRAVRFESDGRWPSASTVISEFGSWNAAIKAAGYQPRARHGGDGNHLRRRKATA